MRVQFKKIFVFFGALAASICYQNCSAGFSTMDSVSSISSLSSTAPTPVPIPIGSPKSVNMVLLYGDSDTTTLSCDGGSTWAYHSFNPNHLHDGDGAYSSTSLTYSNNYMYLMKGWGGAQPTVSRSSDGINWETVYQFPVNYFYSALEVLGNIMIVADGESFVRSTDSGQSFSPLPFTGGSRHLHTLKYDHNGTKILMIGDGIISASNDLGLSWVVSYAPLANETSCASDVEYGAGILVAMGSQGDVCQSTDDGNTWNRIGKLDGGFENHKVVWTGAKFVAYPANQSHAFESSDGKIWNSFPLVNITPYNQSVFFYDSVAKMYFAYGYMNTFFKSLDGFTWMPLPASAQPPTQGGTEYMELFARGQMTIPAGHPCY